jgi:hypothetical protein
VHKTHDLDQNGGWGGVIFFELDHPIGAITHFLYAHLTKDLSNFDTGAHISPGDVVCTLAQVHENGGWPEHLHIQAFTRQAWEMHKGDLNKFDGYGTKEDGQLCPDPMVLL